MDPNNLSNNQYDLFGNLIDPNFQYESPVSRSSNPNSIFNSPDPYRMANPYHYSQMLNEGSPSSYQDLRTPTGSNTPRDVPLFSTQRARREDEATSPAKKKTSKGWTPLEDVLLVSAWLNTSKDSIHGNDQKSDGFWRKVKAYYDENRNESLADRGVHAVFKNRWYRLSKDVNKFGGCYARVVQRNESGQSQADKMERALQLFRDEEKKAFTAMHAWKILKSEQKWNAETGGSSSSKRTKTSMAGAYTSSSNTDNVEHYHVELSDDDFIPSRHTERTIGRDAAKRKERKEKEKNIPASASTASVEMNSYFDAIQSTEEKKLAVMADLAKAQDKKASAKLEKEKTRQRQLDMEIIRMDISTMDPVSLEIHMMMLADVKKRFANI